MILHKNIFQEITIHKSQPIPHGTFCDKLTTKERRSNGGKCPACGGSKQVMVKDGDKNVAEECIMCLDTEEKKTNESN